MKNLAGKTITIGVKESSTVGDVKDSGLEDGRAIFNYNMLRVPVCSCSRFPTKSNKHFCCVFVSAHLRAQNRPVTWGNLFIHHMMNIYNM